MRKTITTEKLLELLNERIEDEHDELYETALGAEDLVNIIIEIQGNCDFDINEEDVFEYVKTELINEIDVEDVNNFLTDNSYPEYIYPMSELDEALSDKSPTEVIELWESCDNSTNDEYFKYDGYDLQTCDVDAVLEEYGNDTIYWKMENRIGLDWYAEEVLDLAAPIANIYNEFIIDDDRKEGE